MPSRAGNRSRRGEAVGRTGERGAPIQSNGILVVMYLDAPQRGKAISYMSDAWKLAKRNMFMQGRNQTHGPALVVATSEG